MSPGNAVYQAAISGMKQVQQNSLLPKLMPAPASIPANFVNKSRPKPPANFMNNRFPSPPAVMQPGNNFQQRNISGQQAMNQGTYIIIIINSIKRSSVYALIPNLLVVLFFLQSIIAKFNLNRLISYYIFVY